MLECTADTWVEARGAASHGRERELQVAGRKHVALFQFRVSSIPGWVVTRATLVLHLEELRVPRKLGVALLPQAWRESERQELPDATLLKQGQWVTVTEKELGWVELALPPALVQQYVDGRAFGFAVYSGVLSAGLTISSRETLSFTPTLIVEGGRQQ